MRHLIGKIILLRFTYQPGKPLPQRLRQIDIERPRLTQQIAVDG